MSSVKAFFEFALSNEWIDRNPARLVRNPRSRANADPRNEERIPFSDDELKRMFEACETQYGKRPIRWSRNIHKRPAEPGLVANYKYKWTGQDLADFISVWVYTGLRISDVSTSILIGCEATGSVTFGRPRADEKYTRGFPNGCRRGFTHALSNLAGSFSVLIPRQI